MDSHVSMFFRDYILHMTESMLVHKIHHKLVHIANQIMDYSVL